MNEDVKSDYDAAYRDYMNMRDKHTSLLRDAEVPNENNAELLINESEKLQNLEESARQRWEVARDAYLQ